MNHGNVEAQVLLLPTVTVSDTNGPGLHGTGGMDLRTSVSLLPTPAAQPSGNTPENHLRKKPGRSVVTDLAILVENDMLGTGGKLLQTPSVADGMGGHERRGGKRSAELLLNGQVKALHGETRETPESNGTPPSVNSPEIMTPARPTGASTNQPSDAGNEPSDDQLPGQLNLLDAITDTA